MFYAKGRAANISLAATLDTARRFNRSLEEMSRDQDLARGDMKLGVCLPVMVPFPKIVKGQILKGRPSMRSRLAGGFTHCVINARGGLYPNHYSYEPGQKWGSLLEHSLQRLWRRAGSQPKPPQVRDLSGTLCAGCDDYACCGGGIAQRALEMEGTCNAPDPMCHRVLARRAQS
jgi:radical SAM protein with 4Fe4S-binding SPASM domain